MLKRKKPEREPRGRFKAEIRKALEEAAREYPKRAARNEAEFIKGKVAAKTDQLIKQHLAQLPTIAAFQPAAFFRERIKMAEYAVRLFDTIYQKVKGKQERVEFLKEFQRDIVGEKNKIEETAGKNQKI